MLENSEIERLRKEVFQLEKLLIELNGEFEENGRQGKPPDYDWEDEQVEYEVRLQEVQYRNDALLAEQKHDATHFA